MTPFQLTSVFDIYLRINDVNNCFVSNKTLNINVNLKGTEQLELNIFEIPESDERNI